MAVTQKALAQTLFIRFFWVRFVIDLGGKESFWRCQNRTDLDGQIRMRLCHLDPGCCITLYHSFDVRTYCWINPRVYVCTQFPNVQNYRCGLSRSVTFMPNDGDPGFTGERRSTEHQMPKLKVILEKAFCPVISLVPASSLEGKTVGLYFSAQWCSPGLKFTPKLVSVYENINQMLQARQGEDFEIVFVSSDRDEEMFGSYFGTMPWLALPFGDPTIGELVRYFDVRSIPCLVILGPDGRTVTKHGRNLINLHLEKAYPFTRSRLEDLEKQLDEEAKVLPRTQHHAGHRHALNLVSQGSGGGPFICCECEEQGSRWAYQCLDCGYEVHPRCIKDGGKV